MTYQRKFLISALTSTMFGLAIMPSLAAETDGAGNAVAAVPETRVADAGMPGPERQMVHWQGGRYDGPRGEYGRGPGPQGDFGRGPGGPRGFGPGPGPGGPGGGPERGAEMLIEKFDVNKDGSITAEEIAAFVTDQMKTFDKDGDGALSLEEYKVLWADGMNRVIVRSFQAIDPDGDAKVTKDEYSERFDDILARLDHNKDGTVDARELAGPGPGPGFAGRGMGPHGPGGPDGRGPGGPGGPDGQGPEAD